MSKAVIFQTEAVEQLFGAGHDSACKISGSHEGKCNLCTSWGSKISDARKLALLSTSVRRDLSAPDSQTDAEPTSAGIHRHSLPCHNTRHPGTSYHPPFSHLQCCSRRPGGRDLFRRPNSRRRLLSLRRRQSCGTKAIRSGEDSDGARSGVFRNSCVLPLA